MHKCDITNLCHATWELRHPFSFHRSTDVGEIKYDVRKLFNIYHWAFHAQKFNYTWLFHKIIIIFLCSMLFLKFWNTNQKTTFHENSKAETARLTPHSAWTNQAINLQCMYAHIYGIDNLHSTKKCCYFNTKVLF